MNKELKKLYASKWEILSKELNKVLNDNTIPIKPTNPLLIKLHNEEEYKNADFRIMFVGQETNDWDSVFHANLDIVLNVYQDFTSGRRFAHKGHFKNHINRFLNLIEQKYPNKKTEWVWNNIVKIGRAEEKGYPPNEIINIEREYFNIFKEELRILKPNIIIFFTGSYDFEIDIKLNNPCRTNIPEFNNSELQLIHIEGIPFAFRTYHPKKINFLGKKNYDKIYNTIIDSIN